MNTLTRVFLLSPASCTGNRAAVLLADSSRFVLARQLRSAGGAPLGEVFSFISQLYFRGKLAYARAFAQVPRTPRGRRLGDGVLVITTSRGLLSWQTPTTLDMLREFASVEMKDLNDAYRRPLEATTGAIAALLRSSDEVVLLGSIATDKYVRVLGEVLGDRLRFPLEFVGRGDMSRGGLMLRCVREARELTYVPLAGTPRHGVRPPRLA